MNHFAPIRFAAAAGIALAASLPAQSPQSQRNPPPVASQAPSTLPATPPTTAPVQPEVPLTPQQRPPQRAQVTYTDGALSVSADNSSLNQILREIANNTGMKITGGVSDERVFGKYGPADPAQILAALLDGTGSNMILVHREGEAHAELILTPRQGGPTPPNPNAHTVDDKPDPRDSPPTQAAQPDPAPAPVTPPETTPVTPATPAAAAGTNPANPAQPDSPNGVKTPQQIYEQLQLMRQQQQQTPQQQQTTQPQ
ncbi:MAG: hypothetical protein ABSA39_08360 [Edaphobacter sp.]